MKKSSMSKMAKKVAKTPTIQKSKGNASIASLVKQSQMSVKGKAC